MEYLVGGVIGLLIGGTIGACAMVLCTVSGKASRAEEAQYKVDR